MRSAIRRASPPVVSGSRVVVEPVSGPEEAVVEIEEVEPVSGSDEVEGVTPVLVLGRPDEAEVVGDADASEVVGDVDASEAVSSFWGSAVVPSLSFGGQAASAIKKRPTKIDGRTLKKGEWSCGERGTISTRIRRFADLTAPDCAPRGPRDAAEAAILVLVNVAVAVLRPSA